MEELIGIITDQASVMLEDGRDFRMSRLGVDTEGYPEVSIDATLVGGYGSFCRQSIKSYIGMRCKFVTTNGTYGYNFEII